MLELYALQMSILQRLGRTCDRFLAILWCDYLHVLEKCITFALTFETLP